MIFYGPMMKLGFSDLRLLSQVKYDQQSRSVVLRTPDERTDYCYKTVRTFRFGIGRLLLDFEDQFVSQTDTQSNHKGDGCLICPITVS